MATKWTSARIEQLFLLIVADIKVDNDALAKKWKEAYPTEQFQPTARAIAEKIGVLKKKQTGGPQGGKAPGLATPKIAKLTSIPTSKRSHETSKTPTRNKRNRMPSMSDDDDDSTSDQEMLDIPVQGPKRSNPSRRSSKFASYAEVDDEEESGPKRAKMAEIPSMDFDMPDISSKLKGGSASSPIKATVINLEDSDEITSAEPRKSSIARSRFTPKLRSLENENESESSVFNPFA